MHVIKVKSAVNKCEETYIQLNDFVDINQFLEFLYRLGFHSLARKIVEIGDIPNNSLDPIIEEYKAVLRITKELDSEIKEALRKIGDDASLCAYESYVQLAGIASTLKSNSRILEIGAFKGASTIALAEGSKALNAQLTTIDLFFGYEDEQSGIHFGTPFLNDLNTWEKNVAIYRNRIRVMPGSSIGILRDLVLNKEKFDLIFLDSSHEIDTHYEIALISCLANDNAILVMDDVIDYHSKQKSKNMALAWANGLKYLTTFPRFAGELAVANFKQTSMPINIKWDVEDYISNICELYMHLFTKDNYQSIKLRILRNESEGINLVVSKEVN